MNELILNLTLLINHYKTFYFHLHYHRLKLIFFIHLFMQIKYLIMPFILFNYLQK